MSEPNIRPVVPAEGLHVLHLFYKIEHGAWSLLSREEQFRAKTSLTTLVAEIRGTPEAQLLFCAVVSPKADLGFMLLCPDLQVATAFEKRLTLALGPDVLAPVFSWFSMTETGDGEGATTASCPDIAEWPVLCFYPMSMRRGGTDNWHALPAGERGKLMAAHARSVRKWEGRVLQLVTGSAGLDDMELGVTLFAHNTADVKGMVRETRLDWAGARYAEFGEFFTGIQLPLGEVFRRVQL